MKTRKPSKRGLAMKTEHITPLSPAGIHPTYSNQPVTGRTKSEIPPHLKQTAGADESGQNVAKKGKTGVSARELADGFGKKNQGSEAGETGGPKVGQVNLLLDPGQQAKEIEEAEALKEEGLPVPAGEARVIDIHA